MRIYVVAVDEPIYLVPYVRAVAEATGSVVGVARLTRRSRFSLSRAAGLALLSLLIYSPRQWARLVGMSVRGLAASCGIGCSRHRLSDMCRDLRIPYRAIASANAAEFVAHLREMRVDVLLNQAPERLAADVLRAPAIAAINRHLSLLPAYRGAWPLFWQFANRETRLGVTVHRIDEGLDSGAVIVQQAVERRPNESMSVALDRLFALSVELTREALSRLQAGVALREQPASTGRICRTPKPSDVLRYIFRLPPRQVAS